MTFLCFMFFFLHGKYPLQWQNGKNRFKIEDLLELLYGGI
jgi:hypothetical protein